MKTKKNLVLVGMMGSGKSTIGNIISKKLDFGFIDTDYEIEKYEKISIKKIFDIKGENYFRKLEETVILKSINLDNKVISLGGGGFLKLNLRKKIQIKCISFWLDWKEDTIVKRIFKNDKRPLARHLSKLDLKDMISKRHKHYKQATHRIICENLNKKEIADEIIKKYEIQ